MTEPDEYGWAIRAGAGLVVDAPVLSEEWRARQRREDEREARQAGLEAELRADAAIERRAELERQGVAPVGVAERLSAIAEMDRREQRKLEERTRLGLPVVDDYWGQSTPTTDDPGRPRLDRYELKKNAAAREAAAQSTPATVAELGDVQQQVTGLKAKLHALMNKQH